VEKQAQYQLLCDQLDTWQQDVQRFVALSGDKLSATDDLEDNNNNNNNNNNTTSTTTSSFTVPQKMERALDERFRAIVSDLDLLVSQILGDGSKFYAFVTEQLLFPVSAMTNTPWVVQCYFDARLQQLPWEATSALSRVFAGRMTRDFSVAMLGQRIQTILSQQTNTAEVVCPASSLRYLCDVFDEDTAGCKTSGREPVSRVLAQLTTSIPGGTKWQKLRSKAGQVSVEDFYSQFDVCGSIIGSTNNNNNNNNNNNPNSVAANTNSKGSKDKDKDANSNNSNNNNSTVVAMCLGRVSSLLSASDLAQRLSLSKLRCLLLFDKCHNETSYRRQISEDVLRQSHRLDYEQDVMVTAALCALSGTSCVAMHLWSTPLFTMQRHLSQTMTTWSTNNNNNNSNNNNSNNNNKKMRLLTHCFTDPIVTIPISIPTNANANAPKNTTTATAKTAANPTANNNTTTTANTTATNTTTTNTANTTKRVKKWISASRVVYGLGFMVYSDA
jgi:hypothetical protein